MTDDFRDCFVGEKGYEALRKLMKSGNDFCVDVAKCLQERSDAEIAYARALRKSSDTLQKIAGRAKGTLSQAFTTLSSQTSKESDAHTLIANTLLNDISLPLKNLAEAQAKERKSIEDTLNGKLKEWNAQKEVDNKYRTRQFDKCKEIESLYIKISELSNSTKSAVKSKTSSVSTPLVMSCVLPGGRMTSASEKLTSNSDVKYNANLETSIRKAEEELEKIERKYHTSTKDVELLRQTWDSEMYRSCDKMQKMELDRITETANFIQTYTNSIQTLTETMNQVTKDLYSIQIVPNNDIIVEARSNVESTEIAILLYDIYAEKEENLMSEQRRILNLMHWIETLRRDVEIQQQTRNEKRRTIVSQKVEQDESPDDDRGSSNDGAMCSRKDIVVNSVHHQDGSSSSSNDDDGAMHRTKKEKKKKEGTGNFSSEVFVDRRGAALLEELYRASLFKIESVYNRLKNLPAPRYEHEQRFARTYNDKGYPTTFLRLPSQQLTHTPPSAPSTTKYFAEAMPMFVASAMQRQPMSYATQRQAPPIGWSVNEVPLERSAPDDRMVPTSAPYPVLMAQAPAPSVKHVRALYPYKAKHKDELDLQPGDIIVLMERRKDDWCKGNLDGKVGLFPGNFVEDCK